LVSTVVVAGFFSSSTAPLVVSSLVSPPSIFTFLSVSGGLAGESEGGLGEVSVVSFTEGGELGFVVSGSDDDGGGLSVSACGGCFWLSSGR
jgi:hypothetical protein